VIIVIVADYTSRSFFSIVRLSKLTSLDVKGQT